MDPRGLRKTGFYNKVPELQEVEHNLCHREVDRRAAKPLSTEQKKSEEPQALHPRRCSSVERDAREVFACLHNKSPLPAQS